ncbi:MAG: ABC transporter ATP-binding protein [Actinomycetota bacterium]|nr:ABC transporter ATP-binding protein [Actinomycetota bacterium]
MSGLRLTGVGKRFGAVTALDGLDLELGAGEFVSLLGPSGCGKTTALRVVAGFEVPDAGTVHVAGKDITRVPANRRDMGMVFQAYSLFPNMTARGNVAFGLRLRRAPAGERRTRAGELLELVGLSQHADRYPHQLSGGQQQRVALARALAIRPQVLLLDEPLSALDAKVRVNLREEIRRIQTELGITTLFVTHDQEEALAVSDRVGVMNEGRLEQLDAPARIYREPATPFVAQFVGVSNLLDGVVADGAVVVHDHRVPLPERSAQGPGTPVRLLVRPEDLRLRSADGPGPTNGSSAGLGAVVLTHNFLGPVTRVTVRLDAAPTPVVRIDVPSDVATGHPSGTRVLVVPEPRAPLVVRPELAALRD